MTGSQTGWFIPVVFHCRQSVFQRAAAAVLTRNESANFDAQLVEHQGFANQEFLTDSCSGAGVEVVQGVDLMEVGFELHQGAEHAPGYR